MVPRKDGFNDKKAYDDTLRTTFFEPPRWCTGLLIIPVVLLLGLPFFEMDLFDEEVDALVAEHEVATATTPVTISSEEDTLGVVVDDGTNDNDEQVAVVDTTTEEVLDVEEEVVLVEEQKEEEVQHSKEVLIALEIAKELELDPEANVHFTSYYIQKMYPEWWDERAKLGDGGCPHDIIPSDVNPADVTVYVPTWWDRSGATVYRLMSSYAYAEFHGYKFGGGIPRSLDPEWIRKSAIHQQLIDSIGLQNVLKFEMPIQGDDNAYNIDWVQCVNRANTAELLTPQFRDKVRSQRILPSESIKDINNISERKTIAMHVRRGDAQPCTKLIFRNRYSPNEFYKLILEKHVDPDVLSNADIIIYSQQESFESWDEFRTLGYTLDLDGDIEDAWVGMMNADILIMSPNSFFSYVPGILNEGDVYSTLANAADYGWLRVDRTIKEQREDILNRLIAQYCDEYVSQHPETLDNHTVW